MQDSPSTQHVKLQSSQTTADPTTKPPGDGFVERRLRRQGREQSTSLAPGKSARALGPEMELPSAQPLKRGSSSHAAGHGTLPGRQGSAPNTSGLQELSSEQIFSPAVPPRRLRASSVEELFDCVSATQQASPGAGTIAPPMLGVAQQAAWPEHLAPRRTLRGR